LSSSNGGSLTNFASGTQNVFVTYPSEKSVYLDASGNVSALGTIASGTWNASTIVTTYGGTGLSSYTAGDLPYYASGTALSKLGIGTSGQILTSSGTAPQWSTLSGVAVTTFSAGTTGFTPSSATSGAITLAGTLAVGNGGTGLTTLTANGVVYASSSSALATGSALTFDGTNFTVTQSAWQFFVGANFAKVQNTTGTSASLFLSDNTDSATIKNIGSSIAFINSSSEGMRLTSTGLGIGTNSPAAKLDVRGSSSFLINSSNPTAWVSVDSGLTTHSVYSQFNTSNNCGVFGTYTSDPIYFVTGNNERMRLTSTGYLGIGTSSPAAPLHVLGSSIFQILQTSSNTQGPYLSFVQSSGSRVGYVGYGGNATSGGLYIHNDNNTPIIFETNASEAMRIDSSGNLLVGYTSSNGSYKLQVNSQIFATSSTIATSDANYKTDVIPLTGMLDIVTKLNPVQFNWKKHLVHNFDTTTTTVGFLAQEVQSTLANTSFVNSIVKKNEVNLPDDTKQEFLGIAEGTMIAILTKAIQEQQALITDLTNRIKTLENK
jgi:hypothetical protein